MSKTNVARRVSSTELRRFVEQTLEAVGVESEHAQRIADGLVHADLRGVSSHGVARLEAYVQKFEEGGFARAPEITTRRVGDALLVVDADDGPGQSTATVAMDAAMELAEDSGIAAAFVKDSNHCGAISYFTQRAAKRDYIGIAASNVGSDVIPYGGRRAFLGTNPLSIAIPTNRRFPLTLDMATSTVAMGKIDHVASVDDTDIPADWAVDQDGNPTTDPHDVAALRPFAGPKGYGLSIMIDVLCGLLTRTRVSPDVGALYDDFDEPMRLGHFLIAINVSALMDPDEFRAAVEAYVDRIKAEPTGDGVEQILVPGEPEAITRLQNEVNGVPLNDDAAESLDRLAARFDLERIH